MICVGRLVLSEFVTVDGVMEDPGGSEGTTRGGWAFRFARGPEGDQFKLDEITSAEVLLLGRRTSSRKLSRIRNGTTPA